MIYFCSQWQWNDVNSTQPNERTNERTDGRTANQPTNQTNEWANDRADRHQNIRQSSVLHAIWIRIRYIAFNECVCVSVCVHVCVNARILWLHTFATRLRVHWTEQLYWHKQYTHTRTHITHPDIFYIGGDIYLDWNAFRRQYSHNCCIPYTLHTAYISSINYKYVCTNCIVYGCKRDSHTVIANRTFILFFYPHFLFCSVAAIFFLSFSLSFLLSLFVLCVYFSFIEFKVRMQHSVHIGWLSCYCYLFT